MSCYTFDGMYYYGIHTTCVMLSYVHLITVGFHNFNLRIFNLRVSNPNKLILDICLTRCRISMCQGLGPKKHDEISEVDRMTHPVRIAIIRSPRFVFVSDWIQPLDILSAGSEFGCYYLSTKGCLGNPTTANWVYRCL